jgi:hypothetical protein
MKITLNKTVQFDINNIEELFSTLSIKIYVEKIDIKEIETGSISKEKISLLKSILPKTAVHKIIEGNGSFVSTSNKVNSQSKYEIIGLKTDDDINEYQRLLKLADEFKAGMKKMIDDKKMNNIVFGYYVSNRLKGETIKQFEERTGVKSPEGIGNE